MKKTLVISGSGGQGVMSAGIIIAEAAVDSGRNAVYLPEYGPQQRGGTAKCTVITDEEEIVSPLASKCDVLIALNSQSYSKFKKAVKPGGTLIVNSSMTGKTENIDGFKIINVPADDISSSLGNIKVSNIVMIGALLSSGADIIGKEEMTKTLVQKFSSKSGSADINLEALNAGINYREK